MKKIILAGAILSTFFAQAQQGIGTNAPSRSSVLELNSTKRGLLIPRIQLTATNAPNPVNEPANALLVYNTADAGSGDTAVTPGFYFWNGTENKWVRMIDNDSQNVYTAGAGMKLSGNEFSRTGLEEVTEDGKTGWRYIGANANQYGNIGIHATDLQFIPEDENEEYSEGSSYSFIRGLIEYASPQNSVISHLNLPFPAFDDNTLRTDIGAKGASSFTSGVYNIAEGSASIAIGAGSRALGEYSFAAGLVNTVIGDRSVAMGSESIAEGNDSFVFGYSSGAIGDQSVAIGARTISKGKQSTAIGCGTIALGNNTTAMGAYNTPNAKNLLSVGNGNDRGRSNIFVITEMDNFSHHVVAIGREVANTTSEAVRLQVNGLVQSETINDNAGGNTDKVVVADTNGVLKTVDRSTVGSNIYTADGEIPTGTTRTVTMADDTANITFTKAGGSNNNPLLIANGTIKMMAADMNSDARLKQNINDLSSNKIDDLRAVSYTWNVEGKKRGGNDKLQYGFIAQEIEKVYPNVVSTDKDGYKSVNYVQVIPILTKALQEERQINREQQKQLDQQAREIEKLKEMINKLAN